MYTLFLSSSKFFIRFFALRHAFLNPSAHFALCDKVYLCQQKKFNVLCQTFKDKPRTVAVSHDAVEVLVDLGQTMNGST